MKGTRCSGCTPTPTVLLMWFFGFLSSKTLPLAKTVDLYQDSYCRVLASNKIRLCDMTFNYCD